MTKLVKVTNNETGKSCMTTPVHAKQLQQSGCEITEAQVAKAKTEAGDPAKKSVLDKLGIGK